MWNLQLTNWSGAIILVFATWWLPWWLFLFLFCISVLLLPKFYQAFLPALIFDLSYVASGVAPLQIALPITTLTIILLVLAVALQSKLRL